MLAAEKVPEGLLRKGLMDCGHPVSGRSGKKRGLQRVSSQPTDMNGPGEAVKFHEKSRRPGFALCGSGDRRPFVFDFTGSIGNNETHVWAVARLCRVKPQEGSCQGATTMI